jgi:hypothetical protein
MNAQQTTAVDGCQQDCEQGDKCPVRTGKGYTCFDLGVCAAPKRPAGEYLPHPTAPLQLAPGAIECYRVGWLGTPAQRRELVRLVRYCAGWGAVMVAAGWLLGIAAGVWQ